jgi:type I restriction enzyme S subunit
MVKIDRGILERLPIAMPPLGEQRKIAAILASVDETIEKTGAVIAQLQVVKKAMMQELLTRGLPGRHTRFKRTDLGEIPDSWDVSRLGDLLDDCRYGTSAKCHSDADGLPVLRIPNVVGGRIDTSDLKYATSASEDMAGWRLQQGDVLLVRTNGNPAYVGRTAVFSEMPGVWLYASYLIRMRVKRDALSPDFLHLALNKRESRKCMNDSIRTSAGNYNLNTQGIAATLIVKPPLSEQMQITSIVEAIEARIEQETAVKKAIAATKQALMSVLLTGEVRVTPDEDAP